MNRFQLWGNRVWWCLLGVFYGFWVYLTIFPIDGVPLHWRESLLLDTLVLVVFLIPFFVFRAWKSPRLAAWLGSLGSVFLSFTFFCCFSMIWTPPAIEPPPFIIPLFFAFGAAVQTGSVLFLRYLGILCWRLLHRTKLNENAAAELEPHGRTPFRANLAMWGLTACAYWCFLLACLRMTASFTRELPEMLALGFLLAVFFLFPYNIFRHWGYTRRVSQTCSFCAISLASLAVALILTASPAFTYAIQRTPILWGGMFSLFAGAGVLMYSVLIVHSVGILCQRRN